MGKREPIITDRKLRGEWAEMVFMVRAAEKGLQISKPWGEMTSYDFVVGRPRHFVAVQVKSTIMELGDGGHSCTVQGGHQPYAPGSFDFLAAYVIFKDAWYILPEDKVVDKKQINFYPDSTKSIYEQYREAWMLLDPAPNSTGRTIKRIQPSAEEVIETF